MPLSFDAADAGALKYHPDEAHFWTPSRIVATKLQFNSWQASQEEHSQRSEIGLPLKKAFPLCQALAMHPARKSRFRRFIGRALGQRQFAQALLQSFFTVIGRRAYEVCTR